MHSHFSHLYCNRLLTWRGKGVNYCVEHSLKLAMLMLAKEQLNAPLT